MKKMKKMMKMMKIRVIDRLQQVITQRKSQTMGRSNMVVLSDSLTSGLNFISSKVLPAGSSKKIGQRMGQSKAKMGQFLPTAEQAEICKHEMHVGNFTMSIRNAAVSHLKGV